MSAHLTIAETAIFGPAGFLLGAALTYLATRRTARDTVTAQREIAAQTLQAQRQLALDGRVWDSKHATYEAMVETLYATTTALHEHDLDAFELKRHELTARNLLVNLIAPESVTDRVGQVMVQLGAYVGHGKLPPPERERLFAQSCDDLGQLATLTRSLIEVTDAMRADLTMRTL